MRLFQIIAAVSGAIAVAVGAFAAHVLKAQLPADMLAIIHTGVQYQFYHTLALLLVASLPANAHRGWLRASAILFSIGLLLFPGSLYVLAVSGVRGLGMITPIGGMAFIGGWLILALFFFKQSGGNNDRTSG